MTLSPVLRVLSTVLCLFVPRKTGQARGSVLSQVNGRLVPIVSAKAGSSITLPQLLRACYHFPQRERTHQWDSIWYPTPVSRS